MKRWLFGDAKNLRLQGGKGAIEAVQLCKATTERAANLMKNPDHILYVLAATIMLEKITFCMILTGLSDELSVC
jgi:hypothetical protein